MSATAVLAAASDLFAVLSDVNQQFDIQKIEYRTPPGDFY